MQSFVFCRNLAASIASWLCAYGQEMPFVQLPAAQCLQACKRLCSVDIGGNHLTGSLVEGVRFGREGRGALYQFGELKLRR